jgi:hypothetical protein
MELKIEAVRRRAIQFPSSQRRVFFCSCALIVQETCSYLQIFFFEAHGDRALNGPSQPLFTDLQHPTMSYVSVMGRHLKCSPSFTSISIWQDLETSEHLTIPIPRTPHLRSSFMVIQRKAYKGPPEAMKHFLTPYVEKYDYPGIESFHWRSSGSNGSSFSCKLPPHTFVHNFLFVTQPHHAEGFPLSHAT